VDAGGGTILLRLAARRSERLLAGPISLIVRNRRGPARLRPLPGPPMNCDPLIRTAFAVRASLLAGSPSFALELADGSLLSLPAPARRGLNGAGRRAELEARLLSETAEQRDRRRAVGALLAGRIAAVQAQAERASSELLRIRAESERRSAAMRADAERQLAHARSEHIDQLRAARRQVEAAYRELEALRAEMAARRAESTEMWLSAGRRGAALAREVDRRVAAEAAVRLLREAAQAERNRALEAEQARDASLAEREALIREHDTIRSQLEGRLLDLSEELEEVRAAAARAESRAPDLEDQNSPSPVGTGTREERLEMALRLADERAAHAEMLLEAEARLRERAQASATLIGDLVLSR
jgi:hypothetical protein